jgi:transporter family protein
LGEASKWAPVDKHNLVLVAISAFAYLGERPSLHEWTGIASVAGCVVVPPTSDSFESWRDF